LKPVITLVALNAVLLAMLLGNADVETTPLGLS
jgi:hypothetical protein